MAFICDNKLGDVIKLITSSNGFPDDSRYSEVASLMARARGGTSVCVCVCVCVCACMCV